MNLFFFVSLLPFSQFPKLHPIWIKFCTVVDTDDVITYAIFGDNRLNDSMVGL